MICPKLKRCSPPFNYDAVIADKGYDSDPLRELLAAQQVEAVIPSRPYRRQPRDYGRIRCAGPYLMLHMTRLSGHMSLLKHAVTIPNDNLVQVKAVIS